MSSDTKETKDLHIACVAYYPYMCALFISYQFVKRFLAIAFYYILFLAEIYMIRVNVVYVLRNEISVGSDKELFFPIYPHCKNCSLWQRRVYRHVVAKVCDFYNGVYGESYFFCRIKLIFFFIRRLFYILQKTRKAFPIDAHM